MKAYIIKRLIYTVIIAWGVLTITFVLLRLAPGSPADKYLANIGARAQNPSQVIAAIEARYGLNKPIHEQYFDYVSHVLRGDWGWSMSTSMPVTQLLKRHWIYSFQVVLLSSILSAVIGIFIGVIAAVKQRTMVDYLATFFSFVGISLPTFWLGIMFILLFGVQLGWFKTYYDTGIPILSLANLKQLTLPAATLTIGQVAGWTRYVRSSVLDNLRQDFVTAARAKGLPERVVIGKHVFRNAMLPIITLILSELGGLVFAGAYLIEIIFGIPGLGRVSFNAVFADDYAVVVAIVLIGAFIVLITNLVTDIAYTYVDPRIRYV
ncbi:MAG: Peptide ABC transporter permease [Dehalococcoidia bacterium]|nr:Peptide ABC transporter permease [Dehalococcoidia bacterium]